MKECFLSNCENRNLPIGAIAFVLIWIFLRLKSQRTRARASVTVRFKNLDPLGVLLIIASVCCLILALHWGSDQGAWNSSKVIGLFVSTGVLLLAFFLVQWKQGDHATVPFRILLQRSVLMGALFSFFLEMSIYVVGLSSQKEQHFLTRSDDLLHSFLLPIGAIGIPNYERRARDSIRRLANCCGARNRVACLMDRPLREEK